MQANLPLQDRQRLCVSENRRYLAYEDGTPFFYLGDTAWELFHRLNREEAARYLTNRAQKGFTVIQAVVLAERDGLVDPNPYGEVPLFDRDPTRPNEAYFEHVDHIVSKAEALGLVIGILPTWGCYWSRTTVFGPDNAATYGAFLGQRYRDHAIIWILGGDRNIRTEKERATVEAMAAGLRAGDGGQHLITYHPRGPGCSSAYLHDAPWLDFNMVQSSHGAHDHDNGLFVERDYALDPPKPTLDGEPRYETIPVGFYFNGANRYDRFDAYDVRQAAYWSLLSGACGHTYGHNAVWQMWAPGRESVLWADIPWYEALDHPGAFQMGLVRRLFESLPYQTLQPDQSLIVNGPTGGGARVRAARARDGRFILAYSPRGAPFTLDRTALCAQRVREAWYDPRYGSAYHVHTSDNAGFQTYTPPTSGRGNDWVLVLSDDAAGWEIGSP